MPKGRSQAEAMLDSEKIEPVALAVLDHELQLSEGISNFLKALFSRLFVLILSSQYYPHCYVGKLKLVSG